MSGWKIVVNFSIAPALVLTILLLLPTPMVVKKGLLIFTKKVLFFKVFDAIRLVHFMMLLSAYALAVSTNQTLRLGRDAVDATLTPNQRTGVLSRKWREERNFWIAFMALMLWAFLNRFYVLMLQHMELKEKVKALEAQLKKSSIAQGNTGGGSGVAAPDAKEATAPPLETEKASGGKKKAA